MEDLTPEELDRYGGANNLTFHQVQLLDAEKADARDAQTRVKGKGKGKGKADLSHDPDFPAWNVKIKNIHLPFGTIPIRDSALGQSFGINEAADLKRAIEESLELERVRKANEEKEHQEILAQIQEAELKEMWDRMDEEHELNRR